MDKHTVNRTPYIRDWRTGAKATHTLRWAEPFAGGYQLNDTGLCNRLFHWEIAYRLSKLTDFKYKILVELPFWPEMLFLDLPNTTYTNIVKGEDFELHSLKFKTVYDTKHGKVSIAEPIDEDKVEEMLNQGLDVIKEHKHWYADFSYDFVHNFQLGWGKSRSPLTHIKFKNPKLARLIQYHTSHCIGIHIRRGSGVFRTEEDLKDVPEDVALTLGPSSKDIDYKFHGDSLYFNYIDRMIQLYPNQQFYISCDLPKEEFEYIKEKYGDHRIKTREDIIPEAFPLAKDTELSDKQAQTVTNLIDLFGLSYCKFIVRSNISTWSEFATLYRGAPYGYIDEPVDDLVYKTDQALQERSLI